MLKSKREATKKKWLDIIIDWESCDLKPSLYCERHNLNLKQFYRHRSLYLKSKSPQLPEDSITSLIPIKITPDKEPDMTTPVVKPPEPSAVEIKLSQLTINTTDKANIDFIYKLITRLTAC